MDLSKILKKCALTALATFSFTAYAANVSTDGSTSMEKVIGMLSEAYHIANDDVTVTYNPTGSGAGIASVQEGRSDIGLSSRALKDSEKNQLKATVIAYDGIVLLVNPKNNIDDLTMDQVGMVFTGKITNWKELGGADKAIVLIGREAGSGTRDGFETASNTKEQCKYRQELTSTGDVVTTISINENAIGYASISSVNKKVKVLKVDGIAASDDTIKNGSYKLQRPFLMVTRKDGKLSEDAQKFMNFALSKEALPLLHKAGVVPASN